MNDYSPSSIIQSLDDIINHNNNDITFLINLLSSLIKNNYQSSKKKITEMNILLTSCSNQIIYSKNILNEIIANNSYHKIPSLINIYEGIINDKISLSKAMNTLDKRLAEFFDSSKITFKKIKAIKTTILEEITLNKNVKSISPYLMYNPPQRLSLKLIKNKIIKSNSQSTFDNLSLINIKHHKNNNYTITSNNNHTFKNHSEIINHSKTISSSQLTIELAQYVIRFIDEMSKLQESIINHYNDTLEKKKSFEKLKLAMKELAENILHDTVQESIDNESNITKEKYRQARQLNMYYKAIIDKQEYDMNIIQREIAKTQKDNKHHKVIEGELSRLKIELEQQKSINRLNAKVEYNKLINEINNLKLELNNKDNEAKIFHNQITDLKKQMNQLLSKRNEENTAINSLKNNIELLQVKSSNDNNSIEYFKSTIDQIAKEKHELIYQKDKLIKENKLLSKEIAESQIVKEKEINYLLMELSMIKKVNFGSKDNFDSDTQTNKLNNQFSSQELTDYAIDVLKTQNEELLKKIIALEAELQDRDEYINQHIISSMNKCNTISVESIEFKNNNSIKHHEQTQRMISTTPRMQDDEVHQLKQANNSFTNQISLLQKQIKKIKAESNQNLMRSKKELTSVFNQTKQDCNKIKTEKEILNQTVAQYQMTISNLKNQLCSEQALSKELSDSFAVQLEINKTNQNEIIKLKEEIKQLKKEYFTVRILKSERNEDSSKGKEHISQLEKEKDLIRIKQRELNQLLVIEKEKVIKSKTQLSEDQEKIKGLSMNLQSSMIFQLDHINALQKSSIDLESTNNLLQKENSDLSKEIGKLNFEINRLRVNNQSNKEEGITKCNKDYRYIFNDSNTPRYEFESNDDYDDITPSTYTIILEKEYNKLKWLLMEKNTRDTGDYDTLDLYLKFKWIPKTKLTNIDKYNNSYIKDTKCNN